VSGLAVVTMAVAGRTVRGDAQSQDATKSSVAFEVASITPNTSATVSPRVGFRPGGRFEVIAATVQDLIEGHAMCRATSDVQRRSACDLNRQRLRIRHRG